MEDIRYQAISGQNIICNCASHKASRGVHVPCPRLINMAAALHTLIGSSDPVQAAEAASHSSSVYAQVPEDSFAATYQRRATEPQAGTMPNLHPAVCSASNGWYRWAFLLITVPVIYVKKHS